MKWIPYTAILLLFSIFVSAQDIPEIPDLDIDGFDSMSQGRLIMIFGVVNHTETGELIEGAVVTVFCNHSGTVNVLADGLVTDQFGFWSVSIWNWFLPSCEEDDEVWVDVLYMDETYASEHQTVVRYLINGFELDYAQINVSVPEFSTVTLAIAVILGTLGLVILRKQ